MKPEEKVEMILWSWLKSIKNSDIKEIYLNRKNCFGCKIFKIKGERKIPDMIIEIENFYGKKYYAIEIKDNNKSKNVLGASKIIDKYFKNYVENKTKYYIDEKEININGFLIATQSSPKGYLFKNEEIVNNLSEPEKKSKFVVTLKYKLIPVKEGKRTFEFIRTLWEWYGRIRNDYDKKLDLGILIGNSEDGFKPYIMITSFYYKKNRWSQRWWKM